MGLRDGTKYKVCIKPKGGEVLTTKRSWLCRDSAKDFLKASLDSGIFYSGCIIALSLNDELLVCEEVEASNVS